MTVFVHAQGIKTVHAGGGFKKWQNSVHVVVECPLTAKFVYQNLYFKRSSKFQLSTYLPLIQFW